jgi:predicted acylesterase/phospholipase RssA/CRP-like cAMP-binding protein
VTKIHGNQQDNTLIEFLAKTDLFAPFDPQTLNKISQEIKEYSLNKGDYLFRQGDSKHSGLYIVVEGQLQSIICDNSGSENVVGLVGPGELVGEMQLMTGQARTADVQAVENTQLLYLSRGTFEELISETPQVLNLLASVIRKRLRRNQLYQILPNYFGQLSLDQMEEIEKQIEWIHLDSGQALINFQDQSDSFFIVVNGRVQARIPDDGGSEIVVSDIYAGENVGELGFFTGEPRAASVYALRETEVVKFSRQGFDVLNSKLPNSTLQFTKQLITTLHSKVLSSNVRKSRYIALVPVNSEFPIKEFTRKLVKVLSQYSNCLHLNSSTVDGVFHKERMSQISQDDIDVMRLVTWLDEQEKTCPVTVIYEADCGLSNWTNRCIQRADRVIFLGLAEIEPDFELCWEVIPAYKENDIQKELVLLYDKPDTSPSETNRWLDQIGGIQRHYHIRRNNNADYRRLARLIAGNSVGLVLGGGGARGIAHIGVLRAIEEAGLEIDLIGGNSIGSVIGACFALGWDWQKIATLTKKFTKKKVLLDYTLPVVSLMGGKPYTTTLRTNFGEKNIEETWIEYFCISADLTHAEQVIHRRGPLWKYVRASSSVFPVYPPITDGGAFLVDGGLVNDFPVDIMNQICEDCTIIGVDISVEKAANQGYDLPPYISGWEMLAKKYNPFHPEKELPGLLNLFMRINEFNSVRKIDEQYELTDYIIRPDVEDIALFQFEDFDEIMERGYQAGKLALENWRDKFYFNKQDDPVKL